VPRTHHYQTTVTWTGNRGTGTSGYKAYGRDNEVTAAGCPPIAGSADRTFTVTGTAGTPSSCSPRPCPSATCCLTCTCARTPAWW
jgi:hypothetical protein